MLLLTVPQAPLWHSSNLPDPLLKNSPLLLIRIPEPEQVPDSTKQRQKFTWINDRNNYNCVTSCFKFASAEIRDLFERHLPLELECKEVLIHWYNYANQIGVAANTRINRRREFKPTYYSMYYLPGARSPEHISWATATSPVYGSYDRQDPERE